MSSSRLITRRHLSAFLAVAAASIASRAFGEDKETPTDGDTGPKQLPDKGARDRGIGGTGVIGTIRGFGSIIVNNLRISYNSHTSVSIDGRRANAAALRVGQVVHVIARKSDRGVATSHIEVTSEVVGPVDFVRWPAMAVLGQAVLVDARFADPAIRKGDIVAISGLRRLDGTIIASRIERRHGSHFQVAGLVVRDASGVTHVGRLVVRGIDPILIGERSVLTGHLVGGVFQVRAGRKDLALLEDSNLSNVSIETYVSRSAGGVAFGLGFQLSTANVGSRIPGAGEFLAIADMHRSADGQLKLGSVHGVSNGAAGPSGAPVGGPPSAPDGPGGAPPPPGGMQGPPTGGSPPSGRDGHTGGPSNANGPPSRN